MTAALGWLAVRVALAGALVVRIGTDAVRVSRGRLPLTRLALPVIVLALTILVANGAIPKLVSLVALAAVDVAVVVIAWSSIRRLTDVREARTLEQRLQSAFAAFFPEAFAAFVAFDITMMAHAWLGARTFFAPPPTAPTTYVHGSKVAIAAMIVAASFVPDAFLTALVVPARYWGATVVLIVLEAWGCAWLFGLYGTMRSRPHALADGDAVVLRNGILQSARLLRGDIIGASSLGVVRRTRVGRDATRGDAAFLTLGGVPVVEVRLRRPVTIDSPIRMMRKSARTLFVASDAPEALCRMLLDPA